MYAGMYARSIFPLTNTIANLTSPFLVMGLIFKAHLAQLTVVYPSIHQKMISSSWLLSVPQYFCKRESHVAISICMFWFWYLAFAFTRSFFAAFDHINS